jgi:5'-3' exonuclease
VSHRLLLDVSSMFYRSYFAMREPGVFAKDGRSVSALHGYLDMVTKLVVDRHPDEVVHVYDDDWRPAPRVALYAGYKGNRAADPEPLPPQFDLLREVLDAFGARQADAASWEADDAIGALCSAVGPGEGVRVDVVTGDRDLIQLVRDPVVRILFTLRGVTEMATYDEAGVLAKYGLPADRSSASRAPPAARQAPAGRRRRTTGSR